jgi:ligand-binding sensor domain-containing protein
MPLVLLLLCLSILPATAQEAQLHKIYIPAQPLLTQPYQEVKATNLPITGVKAIYQSSDGTVWISTQRDGLVSYYGGAIKHYRFDLNNKNSLPGNRIEEVWEESPHVLWITTSDRIVRFNRLLNRFTPFPVNSRYVCKTPDGTLYTTVVGKGLHRVDTVNVALLPVNDQSVMSDKGIHYPEEKMAFIGAMQVDNDGTLWTVGKTKTIDGLFHLDFKTGNWIWHAPDAFHVQGDKQGTKLQKVTNAKAFGAEALYADNKGNVWFGGWGSGLFCFQKKSGRWQQFLFLRGKQENANSENVMLRMTPLSDDELWISSLRTGFVYNYRQKQVYEFSYVEEKGAAPLLQEGTVYTLSDHCGNRWLAGDFGVFKYNLRQDYFAENRKGKLPLTDDQLLTAAYQLGPEHFLIGIGYPAANVMNFKTEIQEVKTGKVLRRIVINKEQDFFWPQQFVPAGNDEFYYCAQKLHRLSLKSGRLQTIPVTIKNEPSYRHEDFYNNLLWNDSTLFSCRRTSANAGLVKINLRNGQAFVFKNHSSQLTGKAPRDNSLLRIMHDSYNRIWCGTSGGIDIFYPDKERFEHYSPIEGDSTSLLGLQPRFCEGPDNTFYTVSQSGVCATKAVPGTKVTFRQLAYLDGAWIVADKTGMVWVGTEKGVARLNPATKQYKIYSGKDGWRWHPMRKPHLLANGFFLMHDGTVIDPAAITKNTIRPRPRLTDFLLAGQPYALDTAIEFKKHIQLNKEENFFSFLFRCNNYISEEDNSYRYRLKGVDEDWVEAGTRTEAYYTALRPGVYDFYVQAANNDGVWGNPEKMVTVTIIPAWYQTWWLKAGSFALVALAFFAFYRQRLLHLKARLQAEKQRGEIIKQEAEMKSLKAEFEKQLAQTEMSALRSQMNPHFIFNCLNSIQLYTLQNNTEAATEYLSKFSRLIRLVLENSRMTVIPLNAELEYLRLYMEMEMMRFKQKLQYTISIAGDVDIEFIEIPPLLLQPYVENAIWHGLMHKEEGGQIDINLAIQKSTTLVITITDNGVGRARAAELKSKGATSKKSFGMHLTSERIALINKLYQTGTYVSIQDLVDSEGQPAGTEVTINIPLYDTTSNHYRG